MLSFLFNLTVNIKERLIRAFLISMVTLVFVDYALQFNASVTGQAVPGWGLLGRWVNMIWHMQFYTSSITAMPALKLEGVRGFSFHVITSFIFSLFYLCFISQKLEWKKQLASGLIFGILLVFIPLGLELPSMGSGFFGSNMPDQWLVVCRILAVHFSFGLGLGVGTVLLRQLTP